MTKIIAAFALTLLIASCGGDRQVDETTSAPSKSEGQKIAPQTDEVEIIGIEEIATRFVKLGLGIGQHDEDFVDAYHGPAKWRAEAVAENKDLASLEAEARLLIEAMDILENQNSDARSAMLRKNLLAGLTRIRMARGETFSFNEETKLLYDAVAPDYSVQSFDNAVSTIEMLLPGDGTVGDRVSAFRETLAIPAEKLEEVFASAIAECKRRTLEHFDLPANERFTVGYVTDKSWSGYNWFQGDGESLIEINTDLPVIVDRAVDLGCHEGYPGHHAWNVMMERDLLKKNGWIEYSIYPLFSPQSLIAEGSANYGIELAFPGDEQLIFESDVLFGLAELDAGNAEKLMQINEASRALLHARNHIAREYLDGNIDREEAITLSMKYGLTSRERAEQGVRFIEQYRGYVINYNLGRDLVEAYVIRRGDEGVDSWDAFAEILTKPTSASDLVAD